MTPEQEIAEAVAILHDACVPPWLVDIGLKEWVLPWEPHERDGSVDAAALLVPRHLTVRIPGMKKRRTVRWKYPTKEHLEQFRQMCRARRVAWAIDRLSYHRYHGHPDALAAFCDPDTAAALAEAKLKGA